MVVWLGLSTLILGLLLEGLEFLNHVLSANCGDYLFVGDAVEKTQFVLENSKNFPLLHCVDLHLLIKNNRFRIAILLCLLGNSPGLRRRQANFRQISNAVAIRVGVTVEAEEARGGDSRCGRLGDIK